MSREALGNFELMVLLAILRTGENAYGVPISYALEEGSGREVLLGSVYAALERLAFPRTSGAARHRIGNPLNAK